MGWKRQPYGFCEECGAAVYDFPGQRFCSRDCADEAQFAANYGESEPQECSVPPRER